MEQAPAKVEIFASGFLGAARAAVEVGGELFVGGSFVAVNNSKLSHVYQGEKTEPTGNNSREYVIRSPRLAPSAVVSENIVLAKALLSENFSHNIAAVKRLYTSSQINEMPRFKSTTDLIA